MRLPAVQQRRFPHQWAFLEFARESEERPQCSGVNGLTHAALPGMASSAAPVRVLNIASIAGFQPILYGRVFGYQSL